MEEMQRAKQGLPGEGAQSFHALRVHHSLWISTNPVFLSFYEGFVTKAWLIKSLAIGDWTQSPGSHPTPEVQGGPKAQTL